LRSRPRQPPEPNLPQFVKYEFDALLECGILANGFLRLLCGNFGGDRRVDFTVA